MATRYTHLYSQLLSMLWTNKESFKVNETSVDFFAIMFLCWCFLIGGLWLLVIGNWWMVIFYDDRKSKTIVSAAFNLKLEDKTKKP